MNRRALQALAWLIMHEIELPALCPAAAATSLSSISRRAEVSGGTQVELPGGMKGKYGSVTSTYHLYPCFSVTLLIALHLDPQTVSVRYTPSICRDTLFILYWPTCCCSNNTSLYSGRYTIIVFISSSFEWQWWKGDIRVARHHTKMS